MRRRRSEAGFSFMEILIVMGIIAVLVGLITVVIKIASERGPVLKTNTLLTKTRGALDHWHSRFRGYPPSNPLRIHVVAQTSVKVQKLENEVNSGIESVYQALYWPGFGTDPDLQEGEIANLDDDALDKAVGPSPKLFEIVDAWGNPLVYFHNEDYVKAEKDPPAYEMGEDDEPFYPKPWRSSKTQAFERPDSYQLFSIGKDGVPNTDDDLKAWSKD